jgi:dihydroorotate dehydrogenase
MLDLPLHPPLMNAAGTLGFAPNPRQLDLTGLGAFVTNPISRAARTPAGGTRFIPYPGGALIHTGHPNPGFGAVLKKHADHWARAGLPIIVHLLADSPAEIYGMVRQLEELEGVSGVELGLPPAAQIPLVRDVIAAAAGELPLAVKAGLDDAPRLAGEIRQAGASAITLGAPRGSLPDGMGKIVGGRLLGGAVFALGLDTLRGLLPLGMPVYFGAGVQNKNQRALVLELGAAGIQLDTSLWKAGRV